MNILSLLLLEQGVNVPLLTQIFSAYLTADKAQKQQILVRNCPAMSRLTPHSEGILAHKSSVGGFSSLSASNPHCPGSS